MYKDKVIIFGTGECARNVINDCQLNIKYNIIAFADNNKDKQGELFNHIEIINPNKIEYFQYDKIIICSIFYKEIYNQLINELKIQPDKIIKYVDIYKKILLNDCFEKRKNEELDEEIIEICEYLNNNDLAIFNYDFNNYYDELEVEVIFDENVKMFYVVHDGKKMYFKKSFKNSVEVLNYYRSILKEQDLKSPHIYLIDEIQVKDGDVVIDAGVAEGNFALSIIDKISKVYLVEVDKEWIEALKETFKEYMDKVVIIEKFLTDYTDKEHITLDSILENEKVNFIKMDIEGAEIQALNGGINTFSKNNDITVVICAYHNENDDLEIKNILRNYDFKISNTRGYMVLNTDFTSNLHQTKYTLRRGLVRGTKIIT